MTMEEDFTSDMPSPVQVSLDELRRGAVPLSSLEDAFGPSSLGIIVVRDLPEHFSQLRSHVLSHSSYLTHLPKNELARLEKPDAKYLVGYSHGKECLKSNQPDLQKGSYYINCAFYRDMSLQNAPSKVGFEFPEYTEPNVWPGEDVLPGFREACEGLCTLVIDVATLVARACDLYGKEKIEGYKLGYMEKVVRGSVTTKARLLHYFPTLAKTKHSGDINEDDWCATHVDHGCLTGLTSAMYIDEGTHPPSKILGDDTRPLPRLPELPSAPDPKAGLYIHDRQNRITQVKIPRDALAFQTGEALERITKGRFRAVPHYVKGSSLRDQVARNTLAVFTQPNLEEIVDAENSINFAEFAREVVGRNQD